MSQKNDVDKQISDTERAISELQADVKSDLSREDVEAIEKYAAQIKAGAALADDDLEFQREIYDLLDMEITFDEIDDVQLAEIRCVLGQTLLSPRGGTDYSFDQRLTIWARLPIGVEADYGPGVFFVHLGETGRQ